MSTWKPPIWYWITLSLLLLWNVIGIVTLIGQVTLSEDAMAMMTPAERQFYLDMPGWVNWAFGLAVFGGFMGCVALLARRKWARPFLIASLIGVIVQFGYNLFIGGGLEVFDTGALALPLITLIIAIFLVWLSGASQRKGWLR